MEDTKNISGAVEALLFIYGEPLETKKIAEILGLEKEQVKTALETLSQALKSEDRGLVLISEDSRAQLATKPEFKQSIEKLIKEEYEENLTPAALETLSLIAYLGPVPRAQVDYFRGVNSAYTVRNLMMRGLVERVSDHKNPHAPSYQASFDLLKHLGVSKIDELPDYQKFQEIISKEAKETQEAQNQS